MRAVRVLDDSSGVEVVDTDRPTPGADDVVVRIAAAGICGTDLHLLHAGFMPGRTPGHELAGFAPDGRAVAIEPVVSCRTCEYCLRGDNPLCLDALPNLIGIGLDGGMAEELAVPEHLLVEIPGGLEVGDASLVEPVAVAVRGLLKAGVGAGSRVAVVGGGTVGLCATATAIEMGADVELVARHDHQRAAGERLGASEPTDEPFAVVIEAAGTSSALADAAQRCAPGGVVMVLAAYWDPAEVPGMALAEKELRLMHSLMYGRTSGVRDVDLAASIVARTPELARSVITHRFPLEGAPEAFAAAANRGDGAIKVVLTP